MGGIPQTFTFKAKKNKKRFVEKVRAKAMRANGKSPKKKEPLGPSSDGGAKNHKRTDDLSPKGVERTHEEPKGLCRGGVQNPSGDYRPSLAPQLVRGSITKNPEKNGTTSKKRKSSSPQQQPKS